MIKKDADVKFDKKGGCLTAHITGDIDHHNAKYVREAIDGTLTSEKPSALILELGGISFMDSSGLGLVLGRYAKAKEVGCTMRICGADKRTVKLLEMAGVGRIIEIAAVSGAKNGGGK